MIKNIKSSDPYKTIGETAKELNLINEKTGKVQTHTLRFWESEFRQIKPSIKAGGRRYYSEKDLEIIRFVKFLLKEKGLTIKGVKKYLLNDETKLDETLNTSINTKNILKSKLSKISKIVKELKK